MKKLLYFLLVVLVSMPMLYGMESSDDTLGLSEDFVVVASNQESTVCITNNTHWQISVRYFDAGDKEQYRIIESNKYEVFNTHALKGSVIFSGVAARAYISLYPYTYSITHLAHLPQVALVISIDDQNKWCVTHNINDNDSFIAMAVTYCNVLENILNTMINKSPSQVSLLPLDSTLYAHRLVAIMKAGSADEASRNIFFEKVASQRLKLFKIMRRMSEQYGVEYATSLALNHVAIPEQFIKSPQDIYIFLGWDLHEGMQKTFAEVAQRIEEMRNAVPDSDDKNWLFRQLKWCFADELTHQEYNAYIQGNLDRLVLSGQDTAKASKLVEQIMDLKCALMPSNRR